MNDSVSETIHYKRSSFSTRLPKTFLYSPTHYWLNPIGDGVYRVGLTKFSTRMLGDIVDQGFEVAPGAQLELGQVIGWIEGFKAIADIYCVAQGEFLGANSALASEIELVTRSPYRKGWLFEISGTPDKNVVDVDGYVKILNGAIDRILAQQEDNQ